MLFHGIPEKRDQGPWVVPGPYKDPGPCEDPGNYQDSGSYEDPGSYENPGPSILQGFMTFIGSRTL